MRAPRRRSRRARPAHNPRLPTLQEARAEARRLGLTVWQRMALHPLATMSSVASGVFMGINLARYFMPHVDLRVAPGTEPWAPTPLVVAKLGSVVRSRVIVHLLPRSQLAATWAALSGRPLPVDPWSLRAFSDPTGTNVYVFADATETPDSLLWLLIHELAHTDIAKDKLLGQSLQGLRNDAYLASDVQHEQNLEEQLANVVATQFFGPLTGRKGTFDRTWWRARVCALGASTLQCPAPAPAAPATPPPAPSTTPPRT